MAHVNNAVYADWLEEAVIAAGDPEATRAVPRLARLEYAAAADAGAALAADAWPAAAAGRSGCATTPARTCSARGSSRAPSE